MVKLPFGVDINNLIDNLIIISWEAAEILLYYSNLIVSTRNKGNFITTKSDESPVTVADLKVNDLKFDLLEHEMSFFSNLNF